MKAVVLTSKARQDYHVALEYYTAVDKSAGRKFVKLISSAIILIRLYPAALAENEDGIRKYHLRRFPYTIAYIEEADRILVLAIMHQKQRPQDLR